MSFLGNLSTSSAKPRVYMSVTPGIGLEILELDLATNSVAGYARRELAYDEANRNIADYEEFKNAVMEMFQEMGVNPKCEVILNMPLVSLGLMDFALLLPDSSITGGIISEVEDSYLFRKAEPSVVWQDVPSVSGQAQGSETRKVIYTAIQQSVISAVGAALESIGASLIGVENSLISTLRALDFAGYAQDQMQPNMTWNLMIVNATGYSIASLSGKNIIDYYEEPLAIKSFEGDEIYDAITQSAQIALMSSPSNYLFIISDTEQVSSALLASKLQTQSSVIVLENNMFKTEPLIPVGLKVLPDYAQYISLQAIGVALADVSDYPLKLQFPGTAAVSKEVTSCTINIGEKEITVSTAAANKVVGIIAAALIIPVVLLSFLIAPKMEESAQTKLSQVRSDTKVLDSEISKYRESLSASVFNAKTAIEQGVKSNRSKLMNYIAAGDAIPQTVWLTYFMTQGNGLVDIKGVASNVEDVYVFFKNVRDSLLGSGLRLQKLEMVSSSVDDAVSGGAGSNYSFEITNMTDEQLNALLGGVQNTFSQQGSSSQQQSQRPQMPPQSGLLSQQPIQGN